MKKVLIAGCAQEISSFNPVECKYEIFHIIQGNEIYDYHLGKNSYIGGAIEEINKSKNIEPVLPMLLKVLLLVLLNIQLLLK